MLSLAICLYWLHFLGGEEHNSLYVLGGHFYCQGQWFVLHINSKSFIWAIVEGNELRFSLDHFWRYECEYIG